MELKWDSCDVSNCTDISTYIQEYCNISLRNNVGEKGKTL